MASDIYILRMKGNLRRQDDLDRTFSIAILIPHVVLALDSLLFSLQNLMPFLPIGFISQLGKMIIALGYVYAFFKSSRMTSSLLFITISTCLLVAIISWMLFPHNQSYLIPVIVRLILAALPAFVFAYSVNDTVLFQAIMRKISYLIYFLAMAQTIVMFYDNPFVGNYSMALSYSLMLPALIALDDLFVKVTLKSSFVFVTSLMAILVFGSRGVLLSIAAFYLIYVVIRLVSASRNRFTELIMLVIPFLVLFLRKNIIRVIMVLLPEKGQVSRTLNLFLKDNISLSGRDNIYLGLLEKIRENPIMGIGIAGDRYLFGEPGLYAHNIFLEIVADFGMIVGTVLIILLVYIAIKTVFVNSTISNRLYLIWFCIGFVSLLVSSSYLESFRFWTFLGFSVRWLSNKQEATSRSASLHEENDLAHIRKSRSC